MKLEITELVFSFEVKPSVTLEMSKCYAVLTDEINALLIILNYYCFRGAE